MGSYTESNHFLMTDLELEETFTQFIEFGKIFDKVTRKHLVHYLNAKIQRKTLPEIQTNSRYFQHLKKSLDKILSHKGLQEVTKENEAMSKQVIEDILRWMRKTDQKIQEDNPYYEEQQRFGAWSHKPTFLWKESWYNLTNYLRGIYESNELDMGFYKKKFEELMPEAPSNLKEQEIQDAQPTKSSLDLAIDDLLSRWDALLSAKILEYEIQRMDEEREGFSELLYAKIEEFTKLIDIVAPVAMESGRFWDMSRGLWKSASFEVLDQYHELLKEEKSVKELVDLLGRMREAEIELEEEIFENVIVRKEWIPDERLRTEISGIHGSNDLNRMLPSEGALIADEDTALAFYQRYAEQQLLSFRYEGKRLVTSNKVNHFSQQRQKKKEKGPFILCIDTSGSMHGLPSQIAKVICFAIMKMAAKEQRKCYLISFSIGIQTINLLDMANSMDKIVDFLTMSFDGGTDVSPALSEGLDMLQTNEYREGDVLMISDFVMFEIREAILKRIKREQQKDTQFHSLTIGTKANPEVLEHFDNCWIYDPDNREIARQLVEDIQSLSSTEYER